MHFREKENLVLWRWDEQYEETASKQEVLDLNRTKCSETQQKEDANKTTAAHNSHNNIQSEGKIFTSYHKQPTLRYLANQIGY